MNLTIEQNYDCSDYGTMVDPTIQVNTDQGRLHGAAPDYTGWANWSTRMALDVKSVPTGDKITSPSGTATLATSGAQDDPRPPHNNQKMTGQLTPLCDTS